MCGSRKYRSKAEVVRVLCEIAPAVVIHGDCPMGPDRFAREWCEDTGTKEERFPAEWDRHGKGAGFVRNMRMALQHPALCLAFWDGASPGTLDMFTKAIKQGVAVRLYPEPKQ